METKELVEKIQGLCSFTTSAQTSVRLYKEIVFYIDCLGIDNNRHKLLKIRDFIAKKVQDVELTGQEYIEFRVDAFVTLIQLGEIMGIIDSWLNDTTPPATQTPPQRKLNIRHYILAYLLDCHAAGTKPENEGNKAKLEAIGVKRTNGTKSGNTFYRNYPLVTNKDLNIGHNLIDIAGENWRQIVLSLSETPQLLDEYLKEKGL
jgi:hypothetical protein